MWDILTVTVWLICVTPMAPSAGTLNWSRQVDQEAAILRTVALDLRVDLPRRGVKLEERALCDSREQCATGRWTGTRPKGIDAATREALGAESGLLDSTVVCASAQPSSCEMRGASALVAMSRPTVTEDSAYVRVLVWQAGVSARFRVSETDWGFVLEKQDDVWTVRLRKLNRVT